MEYTAIIQKTEDGWYAAQCAQIPEAITQGRSIEEVKENLIDAVTLVLQMRKEKTLQAMKQQAAHKYIYRKLAVV
ncbi:MAG: type II toxin-antitoxin system HicB family antitoxin [Prevotellaceae bacterium]|jgi:predicted RNase H-like HicB family nuclease|nr:type II toxin-antitoxin system HicB family antitoxin [Prevotellaceae bacterium]